MPTRKLTDLFVERVKGPTGGRIEYFDAAFPALALRITPNGRKSWCTFYRFNGRLRRFTLGHYPAIKPAQARREAAAALERVRAGFDPATEKRERRNARTPKRDTFGDLVRDYLARHGRKNLALSTFKETRRILESDDLAGWRDQPITQICRRNVIEVIERIEERAVVQANRTLARLGALFNWAVQKDLIAASPAAGVKPPTKESPRDRALTDDELRWLWVACCDIDWPFGPLVKLLVLTAQRRDEVAGMEWSDLDLTTRSWVIPRHKAKNNRTHVVHLSDAAMEVVCALPRVSDTLVFTTTGKTAVSGFSRAKRRIDLEMVEVRRRELLKDARHRSAIKLAAKGPLSVEIPEWNLHDLRRTAATGMARLSFPPHIVDKVLNHVSGTIRGVAAIYNRFEYLEERQAALSAWGLHIQNLTQGAYPKMVAFAAR